MSSEIGVVPPSPDFHHEPTWLVHFLALFNCRSVPKILFTRVAQLSPRWSGDGELVHVDLNCLHLVHPSFEELVKESSWLEAFPNNESRKEELEKRIEREDSRNEILGVFTIESQLTILILVAVAYPEPWCEVVWEHVEQELWEVVQSTCLPLLGVLEAGDIKSFLEFHLSLRKSDFLFVLLKFLIRISILLGNQSPPNLLQLISQSVDVFEEFVDIAQISSYEDFQYLLLLRSTADILRDTNHSSMNAARLGNLVHGNRMRANSAVGIALGSLPPSWRGSTSRQSWKWTPIVLNTPSTMEIIVQAQIYGAISLRELSGISWDDLPLTTKVLVGFSESRNKAFLNGAEILEQLVKDVEIACGKTSMELLLIGTTLVNCCNAIGREVDAENFGLSIWSDVFGSSILSSSVELLQQAFLMVAISDSFLGQGKYSEARTILIRVLTFEPDDDLSMSATLRLLKMSRREKNPSSLFGDWERLGRSIRLFSRLSDILIYECIEETACLFSVLEPDQIAKIPQASYIIKTLTNYNISIYKGSPVSRLNLHRNLEVLKMFRNKHNLFSISGPQLSYCRKLRERFLPASVPIIEKVGSANWHRFKRIKEMREIEMPDETAPPNRSVFQDSGLGSSLGTDQGLSSSFQVARSVTSIRSFMSYEEGATVLPALPVVTSTGERLCYICEKSLKDVKNESQWRRHAFMDLRPYVCVIDGCDADYMSFISRAEFAAHLTHHQHMNVWTCTQCGYADENKDILHDHVSSQNVTDHSEDRCTDFVLQTTVRDLTTQICPFCGDIPGAVQFVGHLCHHLEEISLSAIPRDADMDDDDERESSSGLSLSSNIEGSSAGPCQQIDEIILDDAPYVIKCFCDYNDDDGNTILCETCDTWQHIECYYHGHTEEASRPEFSHACIDCNPRPFDRVLANKMQIEQRQKQDRSKVVEKKKERDERSFKKSRLMANPEVIPKAGAAIGHGDPEDTLLSCRPNSTEDVADDEEGNIRCVCGFDEYPGPPPPLEEDIKHGIKDGGNYAPITDAELTDDLASFFLQCNICQAWEHGACVGIKMETTAPLEYFCEICRKDLHKLYTASNGQRYSQYAFT